MTILHQHDTNINLTFAYPVLQRSLFVVEIHQNYDNIENNYLKNSSLGEVLWRDMLERFPTVLELLCINGSWVVLNIVILL